MDLVAEGQGVNGCRPDGRTSCLCVGHRRPVRHGHREDSGSVWCRNLHPRDSIGHDPSVLRRLRLFALQVKDAYRLDAVPQVHRQVMGQNICKIPVQRETAHRGTVRTRMLISRNPIEPQGVLACQGLFE